MQTLLIIGVALFFWLMGVFAIAVPERVLNLFGTARLTRDGRNEVRGVYGGFGVATAGVLVTALVVPGLRLGILLALAVGLVGMAFGRLVSAAIDGSPGRNPWVFFTVEMLLAGALGLAA